MKKITALTNNLVKDIVSLHSAKGRAQHQHFIAEGMRTIATLLESNYKPVYVLATPLLLEQLIHLQLEPETEIIEVAESVMNKISPSVTASGVVAVFPIPTTPTTVLVAPGVVLANISDPGNMGTLLRSACAFGIKNIVIIDGADCFSPKVVQSSAGTIGRVPLFIYSWPQFIEQSNHLSRCALTVNGGKDFKEIALQNQLLIIGNEAHGLPAAWLKECQEQLTLKMANNVESINAGVAGSIAMYLTLL